MKLKFKIGESVKFGFQTGKSKEKESDSIPKTAALSCSEVPKAVIGNATKEDI